MIGSYDSRIAFVEKLVCAPAPFQSPFDRLRVERRRDAEVLGDAVEQPARHPELVGDVERAERADLELPLAGHDLGVDAGDAEAGFEARVEVRLDDVAAEHLVGADAAVVEALRRREAAAVREAVRAAVLEERVLLLDAEQRLVARVLLGDGREQRARVGRVRRHVGQQHLAHHEHVVAAADRVGTREHGLQHAVGVLPGAWFVLEPSKPQIGRSAPSAEDLRLRAQPRGRLGAVDPDVLRLDSHVLAPVRRSPGAIRCSSPGVSIASLPARDFPAVARM